MARLRQYTKGNVSLLDKVVGTDVENQYNTVNIPIAAIVDLAIDYFSTNGNGDGINQSLLDITTSLDDNTTAIATYQNIVNTHTSEIESIVTRTETLESTFETNEDGTLTISTANISNFAETIASEGFAQATTVDSLSSQVQQIIDGQLTIDTYATIEQLAQTTSTLEGSIATLQDTLTTGYQNYADGIIQTDAFSQAVSGLVTEANGDFASATDFTNLQAQFGTFDANGNLTELSTALADKVTTTISGEGYATASDLTTLESSLQSWVNGQIASSSTAGITGEQLTTVLQGYAEATELTAFKAEVGTFDANGNLTGLSTALADKVTQTIATEGYATSSDVTALESTVNGNTATLTQTASTVADIEGNLTSSYGLVLDTNGNIASMSLLSDSTTGSSISFNSDVFTINVNGTDIAPFVVTENGIALNGQVTFSNASTGEGIDYTDLAQYLTDYNYATTSDLPDTSAFLDQTDLATYLNQNNYTTSSDLPDTSAFLDQAALASYLQDNGYVTGDTVGITELQLLNILSGADTTVNTVINGGTITTGIIANSSFAMPTGSPDAGFSTSGMGINLDNGSIHAEQFYINNDGTANFGGAHSAGSIGSWVVDSSGSLQSSASNPAIVLSPSSAAGTDSASEKIRISATSLPSIAPFGASSLNFTGNSLSGIASSNATWSSATSSSKSAGGATYTKYVSLQDRTLYVDAAQTASNTSYTQPLDGNVNISVPYNETTTINFPNNGGTIKRAAMADFVVEEEFLHSHGVTWTEYFEEGDENWYKEVSNPNHIRYGIAEFDYEVSLVAQIYRKSGSTKTAVGVEKEHLLDSGTQELSTEYFAPIDGNFAGGIEVSQAEMDSLNFHHGFARFGLWENGSANFSEYLTAGDYVIDFRLKIRIFNTKFWGTSAHADTGNRVATPRYRHEISNTTYNGAGASSYTHSIASDGTNSELTTIVFKNSVPKTSIGINGLQIRGSKGYIALGDTTSTNAVVQFWGDAEVVGTLSANTITTLSDGRFKTNIRSISDSIEIVKALNPVGYNWDFGRFHVPGLKHGFIAQEVLDVVPSAVQKNQKTGTLEDGMTLEYNNFIAINTAAIKKLIEKIEALEQEIQILKGNNG